jgi:CBS domain containing-hemolysin-like protein
MPSEDGPSSQPSAKNPFRSFLSRLAGGDPESAPPADPAAPVDIVDQAEAFQDLRVEDVMTPRADVVAVEISTPLGDVVRQFVESEHSRMPVYRETLDDPVGVVHIKDVVRLLAPREDGSAPDWSQPVLHRLRREVLYVPASMRTADLMLKMQTTRIHMALVIDEFGGTDGLVTLENLIEAVVGEIEDEHDVEAEAELVERPGGVVEADARASLEAVEALAGGSLTPEDLEEDIDTIGGLIATIAGRVPQRGEVIEHPGGWDFEILDADPRRIKRVRMRKGERATALAEEGAAARDGSVAST